ncbi:MAG: MFS transporter [Pseudomonadota bacterium]
MQFFYLLKQAPRPLGFGVLHSFGSSFGQTFLIALFVPFMAASLAINETEFANIYAAITIGSALALPFLGRLIDRVDLLHYSIATLTLLAVGCFVLAATGSIWMLLAGLFIVRLAGQGLMTHVAMTGTARYFDRNRGRALALAAFGFPLAEAILPITILGLIALFGWRAAYAGAGVAILVVLMPLAIWLVWQNDRYRSVPGKSTPDDPAAQTDTTRHPALFRSRYIWLCMPMLATPPLVMTALFFHQGLISSAKGIPLAWFAAGFTVFAATSVIGAFGSGPLIDKYSARRLFPWHLIPTMIGIALLSFVSSPWIVPVYMGLVGITTGFATTLRTAIIPELVPIDQIGSVRSTLTAVMVVASAIGPAMYGWMFAANMAIETMLMLTIAGMAVVTVMSWVSERPGFYTPPGISRHSES